MFSETAKKSINLNSMESIAFELDETDLKAIDSNMSSENELSKLSDEELQSINGGFAIRNAKIAGGFAIRNAKLDGGFAIRNAKLDSGFAIKNAAL